MEPIFSNYGIEIFQRDGIYIIRFDSGGIVSHLIEKEITQEEMLKAQKSEKDAWEVLIELDKRGS